jgi:hypothetical protein
LEAVLNEALVRRCSLIHLARGVEYTDNATNRCASTGRSTSVAAGYNTRKRAGSRAHSATNETLLRHLAVLVRLLDVLIRESETVINIRVYLTTSGFVELIVWKEVGGLWCRHRRATNRANQRKGYKCFSHTSSLQV